MKNALETLTQAEAQIAALRSLLTSNPDAFAHWDFCSSFPLQCSLLQFHPRQLPDTLPEREAAAKAVARVFGGTWRKTADGVWRGESQVGGTPCGIILHDVDADKARESQTVEL